MTVEEAIEFAWKMITMDVRGYASTAEAQEDMPELTAALKAIAEAGRAETKPRRMRLVGGGSEHDEIRGCGVFGCQPVEPTALGTGGA